MSTYIAAISVIPSDTINIPQPGVLDSGTSTAGAGAGKIEDTGAEWTNAKTNLVGYNIENGDVVYNTTDSPNNISQISKVFFKDILGMIILAAIFSVVGSRLILQALFSFNATVFFGHKFEPNLLDLHYLVIFYILMILTMIFSIRYALKQELFSEE